MVHLQDALFSLSRLLTIEKVRVLIMSVAEEDRQFFFSNSNRYLASF